MSTTPAPVASSPSGFVKFFEKVGHDIVVAATAVKSAFTKAAAEEPAISQFLQTYGGEAEGLLTTVSPQASAILGTAIKTWGVVANAIDKGGAAAEQNFLNQGADQALIDSIKSSISTVKAVAGPAPAAAVKH